VGKETDSQVACCVGSELQNHSDRDMKSKQSCNVKWSIPVDFNFIPLFICAAVRVLAQGCAHVLKCRVRRGTSSAKRESTECNPSNADCHFVKSRWAHLLQTPGRAHFSFGQLTLELRGCASMNNTQKRASFTWTCTSKVSACGMP
jgi:hypothetical protein